MHKYVNMTADIFSNFSGNVSDMNQCYTEIILYDLPWHNKSRHSCPLGLGTESAQKNEELQKSLFCNWQIVNKLYETLMYYATCNTQYSNCFVHSFCISNLCFQFLSPELLVLLMVSIAGLLWVCIEIESKSDDIYNSVCLFISHLWVVMITIIITGFNNKCLLNQYLG